MLLLMKCMSIFCISRINIFIWPRCLECVSVQLSATPFQRLITGWRLGYVIAPPEVIDRVKKVHDFLTVGAAAPLMEAVVPGLNFGDDYYIELQNHYTHMKNLFVGGLKNIGLTFTEPQGAYYVMVDISEFGYKDDYEFCVDLAEKVGVGAVPGSSFFREDVNQYIRFHFAKKDDTLNAALERLADIRKILKK